MRWEHLRRPKTEPATPSTLFKVTGVGYDPASPDSLAVAYTRLKPVPYARPDGKQDDVIEPTAVFVPYIPTGTWYNCIVDGEYEGEL